MSGMPYLIKHASGVYYAQRKVPERLQTAVPQVMKNGRKRQVYLKRSLGTKDRRQANISIKPVLIDFDRIIRDAEALENSKPPMRASLSAAEIDRMAEYVYAKTLEWDERVRVGGRDELQRMLVTVRRDYVAAGRDPDEIIPFHRYEDLPKYGLSAAQLAGFREQLLDDLRVMREALAMSNIAAVRDEVADALDTFGINLDPNSTSYPPLGAAVLRAYVRALEDIGKRNEGHPVSSPAVPRGPQIACSGATLREALDAWKKERERPDDTVSEYSRAIEMFIQLHGNIPVADIKRSSHARAYREELRLVPSRRSGALLKAGLPELSQWGREHPNAPKVSAGTVNKQLGAVQAILGLAFRNGLVPDDTPWSDPFKDLRLHEERSTRGPFDARGLQAIFDAPLFTKHEIPVGGKGPAAVWLPLLALFVGGRQAEFAGLRVSDVSEDPDTGTPLLWIIPDRNVGRRVKTETSERVVPLHSHLRSLGFLDYVASRSREGEKAWLFPTIAPDQRGGLKAWSKWWGHYLRTHIGIADRDMVFHSFRHGFTDRARAGSVGEEVRKALMGHSDASTVSGGYGAKNMLARWGAKVLTEAVEKISYPGLALSRVRPFVAATSTRIRK
jgi:integrase